ncbi:hypothetical protein Lser_V15G00531 [Lactuca serriola]
MVLSRRFPPPLTTMSYKLEAMDDGELDFSNHEIFVGDIPSSGSMNSFFDEIFNDTHTRVLISTHVTLRDLITMSTPKSYLLRAMTTLNPPTKKVRIVHQETGKL